jgi:PAS domain S-box-containing protein
MRTAVFASALVLDLTFLSWAYRRLHRERIARQEAADEVQRQKDLLAVTLASIGDAVIVTDTGGHITFMNRMAEELTGWELMDATQQPCSQVFRIVNEETHASVTSPVEKVLQTGMIVGLANHTVLIRRDGRELPIDDSGAPIREPGGKIRGVVLVFRDFSDHKQAEKKILEANRALESANRAKDQFLATLSHELRTPLTPVLATLTMWEASDELPAPLRPGVQMLRRNVELEARLIDDLLDLTRIAMGKMPINLELVDVHELLENTTAMYDSEVRAKGIRLNVATNAEHHHATADPARLQQVFWNILKNATKFTPEGGTIRVSTSNDFSGGLIISFTDNGIGMTPELLARLFQPFEQGSEEVVRRSGGLGLGMALSKALLDAQGAQISASSAGADQGSTFTINLRYVSAPTRPRGGGKPSVGLKSEHAPSRSLHILLVEDHADSAEVLAQVLRGMGHKVEAVATVAAALSVFGSREFDLLVSDIGLPDGTGIELIRKVRERFNKPAIALTGFGMDEDIARCRDAGFDAHLTKPVNFQKLALVVKQISAAAASTAPK